MKNLSLEKISLWIGIVSLWTFLFLLSNGAFAQVNWTNIGNGLQTRVVSGFREYRFTAITGYQPYGVTDSLNKKLNLTGGFMSGNINFNDLNAGRGVVWHKNSDHGRIYFESTADSIGDSNLIFENGDDIQDFGGNSEGFIFRKVGINPTDTIDIAKLNLTEFKYKTFDVWHSGNFDPDTKVTTPDPLIASVVLGTTLSTNVIGLVGYSQSPMGDKLAMYNFGGRISTADPVDATDAVNKQSLETSLTGYQLKSEKAAANGYASLGSDGKVPLSQINDALIGSVNYQGTYNIASNTPPLPAVDPSNKGWYYLVTDQKTVFQGDSVFAGDWVISNGIEWASMKQNRPETDPIYNAQKSTLAKTDGSNATGTWPISITGNSATATNSATTSAVLGTTNYLSKFTSSSTLGNSIIFDNGTNVGIDSPSPSAKLDVNGDSHFRSSAQDSRLSIDMNFTTVPAIISSNAAGTVDENLLISPFGGNVGVGMTTMPTAKLDVSGTGNFSGILTAPTAAPGTNTTQVATTAFVQAEIPSVSSGTYTPTIGNLGANVSSATNLQSFYSRTGSIVTVHGTLNVTTTDANPFTFSLSLPIASNFTATDDATGNGSFSFQNGWVEVKGNTGDYCILQGLSANGSGAKTIFYTFTYIVK